MAAKRLAAHRAGRRPRRCWAVPALAVLVLSLAIPLAPLGIGFASPTASSRRSAPSPTCTAGWQAGCCATRSRWRTPTRAAAASLGRPVTWFRDQARWRDVAYLGFSGDRRAGPVRLVVAPSPTRSSRWPCCWSSTRRSAGRWSTCSWSPVVLTAWWLVTPALTLGRASADRGILGSTAASSSSTGWPRSPRPAAETLDHSAAELRRIERDLHDGAQARLAAIGMNVGLAERMIGPTRRPRPSCCGRRGSPPCRRWRTCASVVRGIHPPVLADRGLAGAVEALASPSRCRSRFTPTCRRTARADRVGRLLRGRRVPGQHGQARGGRPRVGPARPRRSALRVVVGDDGRRWAPTPTGRPGRASPQRLAAFDGTMTVTSPVGGPTVVTLEIPCALSSPRTRPSSGTD